MLPSLRTVILQPTLSQRIAMLFRAGEQGAWYDPSDLTTLFQDSAGTTPVTAVEQPVGKVLDKSGRGNHLIQATASKRPTLSARKNLLLATATLSTQNVTTVALPYTLKHTGTGTITLSGTSTAGPLVGAGTLTFTPTAGTLTLTVSGTVTDAQLETGATATGYQRVTTATDYDATAHHKYLKFDGVDDALATAATVDFSATDKMTVWAGVRKLSDAIAAMLIETSANIATNNGAFYISAPEGAGNYGVRNHGVAVGNNGYNAATFAAPISNVLAISHDLAGTVLAAAVSVRVNQVPNTATPTGGAPGGGNFGNYALYVGARAGTSLYFNGHLYSLLIRGAASTPAQIAAGERWVAGKTGVTL